MKVTVEELAPCKKKVHVEVELEEMEKRFRKVYEELREKTQLPGFRPGKAPLFLLRMRFGDYVREKVLEEVVPETYEKAIKEVGIKVATEPKFPVMELEEGKPFKLVIEVEEEPDFELKEYKGIEIEERRYPVSDEDVEEVIERLRQQRVRISDKGDQAAQEGDLVVVSYDVELGGKVLEDKHEEGMTLVLGSRDAVPGFEEALLGHKVGDTVSVEVELGEEHHDRELAGKRVRFIVTLKEVKKRELPEVDENFAKEMGYEGLEDMRKQVREKLQEEFNNRAKAEMIDQIMEKMVAQYEFPVPPSLVEREVERRIDDEKFHLRVKGINPEKADIDWEEKRREAQGDALANVRFSYLLSRIADAEGIEVTKDELWDQIEDTARTLQRPVDDVVKLMQKTGRLQRLSLDMLRSKVLDFLLEHAKMGSASEGPSVKEDLEGR